MIRVAAAHADARADERDLVGARAIATSARRSELDHCAWHRSAQEVESIIVRSQPVVSHAFSLVTRVAAMDTCFSNSPESTPMRE